MSGFVSRLKRIDLIYFTTRNCARCVNEKAKGTFYGFGYAIG
jgi:hypothetical protein